ncbi:aminotransferase DegT [Altererythrobacter sp. Root672]|nr:aminotransferase DegT [Altererythrobacter sp. Root672]
MNVPIARTSLTEAEINSVLGPLESGWLVQGPKVREFEEKWSRFTGADHSLAVTSCTTGLHLAAVALGLKPGDEVIVPAFTWIATANIVEHQQAKVVFCDIDLETFNIDPVAFEAAITERTRGVVPVHLFGLAANMDEISAIARSHGLWVIEDAACGFGAKYKGSHVGTLGDAGVFSFHPRKAITTGEGGMVTTNDADLAETVRRLRDHGAVISDLQRHHGPRPYLLADHTLAGFNQRMTDIQAALGSAQMDRADAIIQERRRLAARYDQALSDIEWLRPPASPDGFEHGYQSYACLFMPEQVAKGEIAFVNERRNNWMDFLQQNGVSTRPATHAVHMLSFYAEKYALAKDAFPRARAANDCSVSLPLFHGMTEAEQEHVIALVRQPPA